MNKMFLTLTCASMLMLGVNSASALIDEAEQPNTKPQKELRIEKRGPQFGMHGKQLADDLGLTEEQRQKAEELRKADFEKMKPLIEEMKAIHKKMDELRQENMKGFEAILTPEQKAKLDGIMLERKKHMKKFGKKHHGPKDGRPFPPFAPKVPDEAK